MKKFSDLFKEQHREKGRFKPTVPRNVPNKVVATPKLDERCWTGYRQIGMKKKGDKVVPNCIQDETSIEIPKDAPTVESIAKKHGVSVEHIKKQLEMGMKVEAEHGKNKGSEREIALDHLNEKPDYYTKLKKYVEEVGGKEEMQVQGSAALTLTSRPNREPMKTLKQFHKEEVDTPPMHVRSMYTRQYAKHGGTISKAKEASAKAYDAVEKMHGKEMRDKLEAYHRRNVNEETKQIDEISAQAHKQYQAAARKDVAALSKHTGGEYGDIAKNIMQRRIKGMSTSTALQARDRMTKLKKEEFEIVEGENKQIKGGDPCWKGYQMVGMKNKGGKKVPNCVPEEVENLDEVSDKTLSSYTQKAKKSADELDSQKKYGKALKRRVGVLSAVSKMTGRAGEKIGQLAKEAYEISPGQYSDPISKMRKKENEPPFEPTKSKQKVVVGKAGKSMATARHLARMAMKKQTEKMKKMPIREESRKASIVKDVMKKKKTADETFQKEPELSSSITKV